MNKFLIFLKKRKPFFELFWLMFFFGLFLVFEKNLVYAQNIQDETPKIFNLPVKINVDIPNEVIYVLNKGESGFVTILDAFNYSLIKKIKNLEIADLFIDNYSKKIYFATKNNFFTSNLLNKEELISLSEQEIVNKFIKIPFEKIINPRKIFVNSKNNIIYILNDNSLIVIDQSLNKIIKTLNFDFIIHEYNYKAYYDFNSDKIYLIPRRNGNLITIDPQKEKIYETVGKLKGWIDFDFNEQNGELYGVTADQKFVVFDVRKEEIKLISSFKKSIRRVFFDLSLEKIFITSWPADDVTIINAKSFNIERIISLPKGASPENLIVGPFKDRLYIINAGINTISVVEINSFEIKKTLLSPQNPTGKLYINPITQDIILPCSQHFINALFVINSKDETFLVPPEGDPFAINFLDNIWRIFTDEQNGNIYILNNIGKFSKITALNPLNHQILWTTSVGLNSRDITIDYFKNLIFLISSDEDIVYLINKSNGEIIKKIIVGDKPIFITANHDFSKIYTANLIDDSISIIDGLNYEVITVKVGRAPEKLFYDKKRKLLHVWNAGDKSVSLIDENNQLIDSVKLPSEIVGTNSFFLGSSELGKSYVIDFNGSIYGIYQENDKFKMKIIKTSQDEEIFDAILDKTENKIIILNQKNKNLEILNLKEDSIENFIDFSKWGIPAQVLDGDDYIFCLILGGYIGRIDPESLTIEDVIALNQNQSYPGYSNVIFNFFGSAFKEGRAVYNKKDKNIYFSLLSTKIPQNPPGIAVFDTNKKIISDIINYNNLNLTEGKKKINYLVLFSIGGLALILGIIVFFLITKITKKIHAF